MRWKRSRTGMAVAAAAAAAAIAVTVAFVSGGPGHASTHASRSMPGTALAAGRGGFAWFRAAARAAPDGGRPRCRPAARCCPSRRR